MTRRIHWFAVIAMVLAATFASAESPEVPAPVVTASVTVVGPTVVGFFPPVTQAEIDADDGAAEGLAHLQFALSDVSKCLAAKEPSIRLELANVLVLESGQSKRTFELPKDWAHAVGAYLAAPGREPRAVYATAGPSSLQLLLPNAAAEYFGEPRCRIES